MATANLICCRQFGRLVWLQPDEQLGPDKASAKKFNDLQTARKKVAELISRPDIDAVELETRSQ